MDYWLTRGGGWDFDRYRQDFPWDPESATTSQTGKADLEPLRAESPQAWGAHRAEIWRALDAILGPMPAFDVPLEPRILEGDDCGTYRRLRVSYRADREEAIPAYLLVPSGPARESPQAWTREKDATSLLHSLARSSLPAVICLHQTVPWGKREPVGLEGNPDLAYAEELAARGFVCLAPDAICFGERYRFGDPYSHYGDAVAFFGQYPEWSVMGKMAYDVQRGVDYLQSLPFVRSDRIGCIGHSHGAYGTLFAMLYEPRIQAGVISCGFTALRSDPKPERWWRLTALMPRLGWFEERVQDTPFDFHHLLALVAPRRLFLSCAVADDIFPNTTNMPQIVGEAKRVYEAMGAGNAIALYTFDGTHRFPEDARALAYQFLAEGLRE